MTSHKLLLSKNYIEKKCNSTNVYKIKVWLCVNKKCTHNNIFTLMYFKNYFVSFHTYTASIQHLTTFLDEPFAHYLTTM